jgi:hypothetical protein
MAAQAEEFQLLKERFKEDLEAFWRHNKRPARHGAACARVLILVADGPGLGPKTAHHRVKRQV